MKQPRRFETRALHSGEHRAGAKEGRDGIFYPISTPIYASTTFSHPNIETTDRVLGGEEQGYSYARYDNPTVRAFEEALVSLEAPEADAGVRAFAFASGMAATHAALAAAELTNGANVLAADQLYGSTATLLVQVFGASGVETRFVDAYDLGAVEKKVAELGSRAVVVESISNPLLRVADIPEISKITRAAGATLIVDNTFGTPYLQRPLELGADIVVHSATKYLSGHGDLTAGVVAAGPPYAAAVEQLRKLVGGVLGPFEAWLAHRGLKTLPLRMGRQCENAREIASSLAAHPKVAKVNHPSLRAHPDHQTAGRVLSDTGGLRLPKRAGALCQGPFSGRHLYPRYPSRHLLAPRALAVAAGEARGRGEPPAALGGDRGRWGCDLRPRTGPRTALESRMHREPRGQF